MAKEVIKLVKSYNQHYRKRKEFNKYKIEKNHSNTGTRTITEVKHGQAWSEPTAVTASVSSDMCATQFC